MLDDQMTFDSYLTDDEPDLESIIKEHGSSIVKYCYNLLWDFHEAQDAAQEVFLVVTVKLTGLRDSDSLKTWLYRIAHNICMDMLRRKKRAKLIQNRANSEHSADEYRDSYDFGISRDLHAALNTLSPKDRALVFNRAVDEMDFSQMEKIYGVKSSTLRKRYERARKKLEQALGKEELL